MANFTTSDGLTLHYEDTGTGQPLLCLAGLTRNTRDFDFLRPHMGDIRLIAMDYRGRGQSDYDDNFLNYTVMREGQDVIELLDHLGLDKVTILGTSRGGLIAMALAAGFATRLSGVILNDVGPVISPEGIARILTYLGKPPLAKTMDEAAQMLSVAMATQFPGVAASVWLQVANAQFTQHETGLDLRYDARLLDALQAQAAEGPVPDLWPLFDALKPLPTAVIRGANSDLLDPQTYADMQARNPDLIAVQVPDRGHVPFLDEPASLAVIRRILELAK